MFSTAYPPDAIVIARAGDKDDGQGVVLHHQHTDEELQDRKRQSEPKTLRCEPEHRSCEGEPEQSADNAL